EDRLTPQALGIQANRDKKDLERPYDRMGHVVNPLHQTRMCRAAEDERERGAWSRDLCALWRSGAQWSHLEQFRFEHGARLQVNTKCFTQASGKRRYGKSLQHGACPPTRNECGVLRPSALGSARRLGPRQWHDARRGDDELPVRRRCPVELEVA